MKRGAGYRLLFVTVALGMSSLVAGCGGGDKPAGSEDVKTIAVESGSFYDVMAQKLNTMLQSKDFLFINVHIPYEGEIAKTDLFIPYDRIEEELAQLPSDKEAKIVLYCRSGHMSSIAAQTLVKLKYRNVWNLHGGMVLWEQEGLPLVKNAPQ